MPDDNSVTKYALLDFSSGSLGREELNEAVEREAQSDHIKLTDHVGDIPAKSAFRAGEFSTA